LEMLMGTTSHDWNSIAISAMVTQRIENMVTEPLYRLRLSPFTWPTSEK